MCVYYILNIFYYYVKLKANVIYCCRTVHTPHLGHKRSIFYSSFFFSFLTTKLKRTSTTKDRLLHSCLVAARRSPIETRCPLLIRGILIDLCPLHFFWLLHNYFTYLHNKHVPQEVKLSYIKLLSWACQTSLWWICIDFLPHLTVVKMFTFQLLGTFKKIDITDKAKYLAFISMHGFIIICKLVLSQISSGCLLYYFYDFTVCV